MSTNVIAASTTEQLIEGFRTKRLTKTQVIAALTAAGATAAGAALLVQAIEASPSTPPAATPAVSHHPGHQLAGSIAPTNQVALHQRHIALQSAH